MLTAKLNSKVSNGPWLGTDSKREGLQKHDVLLLNRELLRKAGDQWTDSAIQSRTDELTGIIIQIWPVPPNHRVRLAHEKVGRHVQSVDVADLIGAGLLQPGMSLYPRRQKYAAQVATLLADGQIDVNGTAYAKPIHAASAITGKRTSGFGFFLVDRESKKSLRVIRRDYVTAMAVEAEEDDGDDDADEDEA